ncbi:hypothetical protein LXL04_010261 [Taraxacum kok-saghyz]
MLSEEEPGYRYSVVSELRCAMLRSSVVSDLGSSVVSDLRSSVVSDLGSVITVFDTTFTWSSSSGVANIILDPILIFVCKLGVSGAAISHVLSHLLQVIASTICVTLAASFAARLGAKPMAAFQICLQVWMASSLLADGLAVAGQFKPYKILIPISVFPILQMGAKFIQKGRRENIFKEVFGEIEEEKTKILLENRPFVCTSFIF